MKFDIYKVITERIIEQLESGIVPWQKPWTGTPDGAISYVTGKPYSILNQMLLGKCGEWLTFKQIQETGGKLKKGSKAKMVTFWKAYEKEWPNDNNENAEKEKTTIFLLRYYNVYHIEDCEGIEPKHKAKTTPHNPIQAAESIINNYCAKNKNLKFHTYVTDKAYYSPLSDMVVIPKIEQFPCVEEYYSTAFHELIHSTGRFDRCNREDDKKNNHFGNEGYSKEELIAEIGAAALMNITGIETAKSFKNSAAYINSWIEVLKNDKRFIVSASSKADKAVKYILGMDIQESRKTA